MLGVKTVTYSAPAIAARVAEFTNNGDLAPYCVVENLDGTASAAIRYQESDDGNTWTDIAGTTRTVNPGKSDGQLVVSTKRLIALHAGGNVRISLGLIRQVDGAPTDLGVA